MAKRKTKAQLAEELAKLLLDREDEQNQARFNLKIAIDERNNMEKRCSQLERNIQALQADNKHKEDELNVAADTCQTLNKLLASMRTLTCDCGNDARYIDADSKLVCGICPVKSGKDSIRISDVGPALEILRAVQAGLLVSVADRHKLLAWLGPVKGKKEDRAAIDTETTDSETTDSPTLAKPIHVDDWVTLKNVYPGGGFQKRQVMRIKDDNALVMVGETAEWYPLERLRHA